VKIFTNSDQRSRASANQRPRAFTLIELLIVVGIIAILAAIAVPNFLESQVRAKISRVRSDMRTIAIAVESYAVDNNTYPFVPQTFTDLPARMRQITSPIAYLTTIPADPFARKVDTLYGLGSIEDAKGSAYLYNTGNASGGGRNRRSELAQPPVLGAHEWWARSPHPVPVLAVRGYVRDFARLS
jgi:type II secretion system protein G